MLNQNELRKLFYEIWVPKAEQEITIVASPSFDELADAELTSPNYALLDRCGDRDSIFASGKLLSRMYPKAQIHLITSDDLPHQTLMRNLVVIGGPGGHSVEPTGAMEFLEGNAVCRIFSQKIGTKISYSDDCEKMFVGGREFVSTYDTDQHMNLDYGYFASFKNPFLKGARVIMLHGTHTLGVLGATRVFDPVLDAMHNFEVYRDVTSSKEARSDFEFECFFSVEVTKGNVICPTIVQENIFEIGTEMFADNVHDRFLKTEHSQDHGVLKQLVLDKIRVCRNETDVRSKSERLQRLVTFFERQSVVPHDSLKKINDVIDDNPSLPEDSIRMIEELLNVG